MAKRSLFKRGIIFVTFFGCCISMAFLAASLSTKHWVTAAPKRLLHPSESEGRIYLGLFEGRRELNVGYGLRVNDLNVLKILKDEATLYVYSLWIATITCVAAGLLFAFVGACFAIVNTAATPIENWSGVPGLYAWNILSLLAALGAIVIWMVHFYMRLTYNVLIKEDRDNQWSSESRAFFGYSFWFVVGSLLSHLFNIAILAVGTAEKKRPIPPSVVDGKPNGAVLLY